MAHFSSLTHAGTTPASIVRAHRLLCDYKARAQGNRAHFFFLTKAKNKTLGEHSPPEPSDLGRTRAPHRGSRDTNGPHEGLCPWRLEERLKAESGECAPCSDTSKLARIVHHGAPRNLPTASPHHTTVGCLVTRLTAPPRPRITTHHSLSLLSDARDPPHRRSSLPSLTCRQNWLSSSGDERPLGGGSGPCHWTDVLVSVASRSRGLGDTTYECFVFSPPPHAVMLKKPSSRQCSQLTRPSDLIIRPFPPPFPAPPAMAMQVERPDQRDDIPGSSQAPARSTHGGDETSSPGSGALAQPQQQPRSRWVQSAASWLRFAFGTGSLAHRAVGSIMGGSGYGYGYGGGAPPPGTERRRHRGLRRNHQAAAGGGSFFGGGMDGLDADDGAVEVGSMVSGTLTAVRDESVLCVRVKVNRKKTK